MRAHGTHCCGYERKHGRRDLLFVGLVEKRGGELVLDLEAETQRVLEEREAENYGINLCTVRLSAINMACLRTTELVPCNVQKENDHTAWLHG